MNLLPATLIAATLALSACTDNTENTSAASTPVTAAPRRAIGSATSPPPQPMSSSASPANGAGPRRTRPNCAAICPAIH